jgi:hypothetical protein
MLRTLPFTFLLFASCGFSIAVNAQTSLGSVVANTNPALPNSYNFQEYVFAEPNDQGVCTGVTNSSASISDIFFAQTHRNSIDNPFYFLIGYRPALLQIAVTGNGAAPDVMVEGFLNGSSLGSLCLKGPAELSASVNLDVPDFDNYFSVTLPKAWVQPGLTLSVKVGEQRRELSEAQLKVGPYTELNLVMFELDVLDYNLEEHRTPIINNFLQETASSIPASVIRYGTFPALLRFPEIIANNDTEQLVRLKSRSEMPVNNILSDGYINSIATLFMTSIQRSTADSLSTLYFGNTLNLAPGGWGGGHSFVSFDFDDVYIHELGHALSLPHWGVAADPNNQYLYPYDGISGQGGGRGEAWNFIQDIYEFVDPICQYDERGVAGQETSDAMQRNNHCFGKRSNSKGPWDGFGNFSALAIHRYLAGAQETAGNVTYKGQQKGYRLNTQQGFPSVNLVENERVYTRHPAQPQEKSYQENFRPVGKELANQDVYLLYGTTHETQDQANILYAPVKFNGTLPPVLDPTDPTTFEQFKTNSVYASLLGSPRDLTFKMTYADGSILHAVNPYQSFTRVADYPADYFNIWRYDLSNFALVVPGDKELLKVELFHRPFVVRGDSTEGSVFDSAQNITAANFMNGAVLKAEYDLTVPPILPLAKNSIGNRVWHDLNRNSIDDLGEPGIAGVKLLLWRDSDGDGLPDSSGFAGAKTTDANGNFRFIDLDPGNYMVFVWHLENWLSTGPLFKMVPSAQFAEPNNDINNDNNGRATNAAGISFPGLGSFEVEPGVIGYDVPSGSIELTTEGEPLNDGDFVDGRFDYDRSGNMTVDFGFHLKELTAYYNAEVLAIPSLAVNGVNYKVELRLQSSTTIDFQVTVASITTDLASNDLASFSNNELSIPNLLVGSDTYSVVLTLSNSARSIFSLKSAVKN